MATLTASDGDNSLLHSVGAIFDHVAHAVPSIRELLPLYRDILGGELAGGGFNEWGGHLAVHFTFPGGGRVELLEPIQPDSSSVGRFLERNPRGGLHHLTFKVSELQAALVRVVAAGWETFGTKLDEPSWKETYLHPRSTGGVLIQLVESHPGLPPAFERPLEEILDEADNRRGQAGFAETVLA
jgi:methylmalonyl-CoA/ethylmalonyl-CoA epimerase